MGQGFLSVSFSGNSSQLLLTMADIPDFDLNEEEREALDLGSLGEDPLLSRTCGSQQGFTPETR